MFQKESQETGGSRGAYFQPGGATVYLPNPAVAYDHRNYLTGFHKRKAERQQKAAEYAKEQARKEKLETRKEVSASVGDGLIVDS